MIRDAQKEIWIREAAARLCYRGDRDTLENCRELLNGKQMKIIGVILAMIVVAFAVNILMGGGEVTKAHFDERINEINARIDSVRADVAKVWNVSRETKANTDSIKAEVRTLDGKIDALQKDVKDIKQTTQTIEFKLF